MGPKACRLNWETAAIHTAFVAVVVEEHRNCAVLQLPWPPRHAEGRLTCDRCSHTHVHGSSHLLLAQGSIGVLVH